jgi:hypothetical protein
MADESLETEYLEFISDLHGRMVDADQSRATAFFEIYAALAAENGDCPDLEPCDIAREGRGAYKVDGHAFDPERGILYVAVCDPRGDGSLETLNSSQLDALSGRARRFVEHIFTPEFAKGLLEGSPEDFAVGVIVASPELLKRVQILIFSAARLSTRRPPELSGSIDGRPVVSNILDFARFAAITRSKGVVEPIEVDLAALAGTPIPCLPAFSEASGYHSFLIALPGEVLAGVYGLYGPRLLEQNVRTFLQARTKVNKGINTTLRETPEMFFAYNNGITATASAVSTERLANGMLGIAKIEDLQIVNGGQTTASILHARDQGADLSKVFVQMKLSVVERRLIEEVVPRISRYANTQNRISEADFFSGHPFHVTLEQMSRRLVPPPRAGTLTGPKWFYERARGQYRDERGRGTISDRRRFEAEFPKAQLIEKTDLAKYELTFATWPHVVCLGAQKCFLAFAERIAKEWEIAPLSFNDGWFRNAIARALIFRWTDRMIAGTDWYRANRGHKSQTVAYTVAWLQHHLRQKGKAGLNFQLVWNQQDIPEELKATLAALAPQIARKLRDAPDHMRDISQFAKHPACWTLIAGTKFDVPDLPEAILIDHEEQRESSREHVALRRIDADIEMDRLMVAIAGRVDELTTFARKKGLLSPRSDAALRRLARGQFALAPSERNALRHLFERLSAKGFPMPAPDAPAAESQVRERHIQLSGANSRQVRV